MEIKRIMVPVDESDHSLKAVRYSVQFAEKMQCSILLLHCHKEFPSVLGEPYLQNAIEKILKESDTVLEPYRKILKENKADFEELVLEEPAGKAIVETAEIENIDLIIMGTKGKTDLEGLIMGSTTHRVLHLAPCPVLIVR